ncbi:adenylyl-sulfate kinase [Desulfobotulus sp. H1]|uniref:Adenylyl-sulfate kinase n=1 Tax=Desulfobotulus pelophilus TaxID=2823377 RepID=A0ABT3NDL7_9BACT|nr:adenylyl-sulfate kinase [Desulfobotulus pelophilus]MCW7755281.1 adenylyl-sulfate kinase [Desulfobotulus pelophilus]
MHRHSEDGFVCPNTVPYRGRVTCNHREALLRQKGLALWFTGLSGSGKSTIAHAVEDKLYNMGKLTYVFDGDNVRHGLCRDLSFSPEGRAENIRRISEMIKLFLDAGIICLSAFISPLKTDRERARTIIDCGRFFEIYVKCPLEVCEERDVKGLYKLAREGKIKNYTGVSAPYDPPENPDLVLETDKVPVDKCIDIVMEFIQDAMKRI